MIRISVLDERSVRGQNFKENLVISITSPGRQYVELEGENVYRFKFHDIQHDLGLVETHNFIGVVNVMSKEIAESIAEIAMNSRYIDRWVIHCEAGISRSPGVAIGLASVIRTVPSRARLMEMFPGYNRAVASLVETAIKAKLAELTVELDTQAGCDGG